MTTPSTKLGAIQIQADRDHARTVILHPENDDIFTMTGRQVIESCRLGISIELWLQEFNAMLAHVAEWTARSTRVSACYCTTRGSRLALFFVPASGAFDFDLADELVELNGNLIKDFNIGTLSVHQIPADELTRFVTPETSRQVYGQQSASPSAMDA